MPPPKKVDLLPSALKEWLHDALKANGFAAYEAITEELNIKLADAGQELRIGKSAVHSYSQEYRDFVKYQQEAATWAEGWAAEEGISDEAQRHSVLFQMVTTLAHKFMRDKASDGKEVSAMDLQLIGKLLKDIMTSSGLREKLLDAERERMARETKAAAASAVEKSAASMGLTGDTVAAIKAEILGVDT